MLKFISSRTLILLNKKLIFFNIHLSDDWNNADKYTVRLNRQGKFRSAPDKIAVDQISNCFLLSVTLSEALFVSGCAGNL
jgi:hypothetical protein